MLRTIGSRAAGGFAYGVLAGQVVQIILSFALGEGQFMPVLPEFRSLFESELTAVIVQILLTGMIGVAFGAGSVVFDIAKWSLLTQYAVHFAITVAVWMPVVAVCWMPATYWSLFILGANFLVTYGITWFIQYKISKKDIEKINAAIQMKN